MHYIQNELIIMWDNSKIIIVTFVMLALLYVVPSRWLDLWDERKIDEINKKKVPQFLLEEILVPFVHFSSCQSSWRWTIRNRLALIIP